MEEVKSFDKFFLNEELYPEQFDRKNTAFEPNRDANLERRLTALYNRGMSGDREFRELVDIVDNIYKMIR